MSSSRKLSAIAVFLLIFALAAVTRFWGLGWGLPHTYHVDENHFAGKAMKMLGGNLNPAFFHVPTLHMYTLAGMWRVYYQIEKAAGNDASIAEFTDTYIQSPTVFYLIGRALSALMGALTVILLYLLGKRMYGPRAGAIAALLLVFGLDHTRISHDMLPDVPMVFFLVLGYIFIWNIAEKGRTRDYLWAGVAAGLAMTTKYGGLMLFIPLFIAHIYRVRETKRPIREIILSPRLIGAGLIFLAVFVIGSPYVILDFKTFFRDFKWQSSHLAAEGHFGDPAGESSILFYFRYGFKENLGVIAQFLALGGVVLGLLRRRKMDVILLSYPLVQFAMISMWKTRATRYLFPMAPFFALIAALFLDRLLSLGDQAIVPAGAGRVRKIAWTAAVALVIAGVCAPSAMKIWKLDKALAGTDSRTRAKEWIEYNIPPGTRLALEMYGPPISRQQYAILYDHTLSKMDLEYLSFAGTDYAVTADTMAARFTQYPEEFPREADYYHSLDREANLVKTIKPGFQESLQEIHMPEIKIYRLSRAPAAGFPVNFRAYVQRVKMERTGADEWSIKTVVSVEGGLGVGERPENLYVKIEDGEGREVARIIVRSGALPVDGSWTGEASAVLPDIPEGAVVELGYEYILAPNPIAYPLARPLRKEYRFPESIDRTAREAGRWEAEFRYAALPGPGGDHFQTVSVAPKDGGVLVQSRVFGPALRYGDSRILNPFVLFRDEAGNDLHKLVVFAGRLGAFEADGKGPAQAGIILPALPPGFRVFLGRDDGSARSAPQVPTGPVLYELPRIPNVI